MPYASNRRDRREVFYKKVILENFAKFLQKNCRNLLINPNLGGFLGVRFEVGGGG